MRVFVSIRPSADARLHLQNALDEVRQTAGQSLRWGDADQWHLTLAFRADLPEGAVPDALDGLAAIASGHGPLTLHLSGAGTFSGRTLWIGVGGQVSRLETLMREELLYTRASAEAPRYRGRLLIYRRAAGETCILIT